MCMCYKCDYVFFVFCLSKTSFSQDILYTTKAEKLEVKVVEIDGNIINYLDFNNLAGPSKYISKIDIVMIQYANGVKEIVTEKGRNTTSAKTPEFSRHLHGSRQKATLP